MSSREHRDPRLKDAALRVMGQAHRKKRHATGGLEGGLAHICVAARLPSWRPVIIGRLTHAAFVGRG